MPSERKRAFSQTMPLDAVIQPEPEISRNGESRDEKNKRNDRGMFLCLKTDALPEVDRLLLSSDKIRKRQKISCAL